MCVALLVAFVFGLFWSAGEWLHLYFTCDICKLDYEKTLLFVFRHAYFRCPFCQRGYALEKRGTKCVFKGDPLDPPSRPIIRPFEVEWKQPLEFFQ